MEKFLICIQRRRVQITLGPVFTNGRMTEWFIVMVLKTIEPVMVPKVRIFLLPYFLKYLNQDIHYVILVWVIILLKTEGRL